MFRPFAYWLAKTPVSNSLQDHLWVVPVSQSLHIVGVSIVFTSALLINLRILGVGVGGRSVSQLTSAVVPWMWRGLVLLVFTGVIQTVAEPVRQFVAPVFWAKMLMLVIVVFLSTLYIRSVRRNAGTWDRTEERQLRAKAFAVVSTGLWLAIIACGRFIGYTWAFYV